MSQQKQGSGCGVLIVGVLVSMFSAVTVTRTMLRYVTRTSWGRRLELYHVER